MNSSFWQCLGESRPWWKDLQDNELRLRYKKAFGYDIAKRPMHDFSFAVQGRHVLRDTVISTASMPLQK